MFEPLGLRQACRLLRAGRLEAREYLETCARRADAVEPWLHAFVYRPETLTAGAGGPLAGIPVAVKDLIDTRDMPTCCGSAAFADRVPLRDAAIVTRLRELGAVIFGKTVTTEFAWREPGPTVNPHNPAHTPGGSSSGSAAAVAAGIAPLAIGSQTLGSIIRPAAFCGVVGFKASFGAVPRGGVQPLAGSLDHVGFFTREVDDAAWAFDLLRRRAPGDEPGALCLPPSGVDAERGLEPLPNPRFAVVQAPYRERLTPGQISAFDAALEKLRAAGATVEEADLPPEFWRGLDDSTTLLQAESAQIYGDLVEKFPARTSGHLKELVAEGRAIPAVRYIDALRRQTEWRARFADELAGFDALLTSPAPGAAPEGLASTGDPIFCALWTFLGVPALTLPIAREPNGLPLGIQLVGFYAQDTRLLRTAKWAEQTLAFRMPVPG
jgi:Asp-tRNA(Asn)/Glu-tRNA(Gln) amidotransferase A subunit family amidase